MNLNNNFELKKILDDEEDEETLIINEDLFEQKEMSDEEQIIQNEGRDEEFSYNSNKSKKNPIFLNEKNKQKIIKENEEKLTDIKLKNVNNEKKINNDNNNFINDDNLEQYNINIPEDDNKIKIKHYNNNLYKKKNDKNNINKLGKEVQSIEIAEKEEEKYKKKLLNNDNTLNKDNTINKKDSTNNSQLDNKMKNKKIIIGKEVKISNKNNKSMILNKYKQSNILTNDSESLIKSEYKKNSCDYLINNINIKNKDDNSKKYRDIKNLSNTTSKNKSKTKAIIRGINAKNIKNINITKENNINIRKKNYIINFKEKTKDRNSQSSNKKNDNKIIKMKDKSIHNKSQSQYIYNINSANNNKRIKNIYFENKSKNNSISKEKDKKNELSLRTGNNDHIHNIILLRKIKHEYEAETLKKIYINKMNNQIEEIIKGKHKKFFNENNNLFFLGFCDLLFELGFLHIKETEITDISKIEDHIKDLHTQPFTNKNLLCENFLFNEQRLLISAWKTILNNFHLIKEFKSIPQENEEITLDDFKLFVFIITGLFIGYSGNYLYNDSKDNLNNTNQEIYINNNNSSNNLKSFITPKEKYSNGAIERNILRNYNQFEYEKKNKLNKRYNNSPSPKRNNIYLIKKNDSYIFQDNNKENILKKILNNRKKSDYNFKNILKIKNYFIYFSELRKLSNLYKKDLKNINKKINIEKEFTFFPKINKNSNILLNKFSPSMNFFERSDLIKSKNKEKLKNLENERLNELLKECTFKPYKKNRIENINIDPIEISNRLYYNSSSKKDKNKINNNTEKNSRKNSRHNSNIKINKKITNDNSEIFYKPKYNSKILKKYDTSYNNTKNHKRSNNNISNNMKINIPNRNNKININYSNNSKEEEYSYSPDINKKFNRGVLSHTPLLNDDLQKKRINCFHSTNFKYDKNNREFLINNVKKNKKILNENINEEKEIMKLDIEKKTKKDNYDNFKNNDNIFNYDLINEPLFIVEIKIKNEIKMIAVYFDDTPEKIAYDFCDKNSLGEGSYKRLFMIINNKLKEIKNIFNENMNIYNNKYQNKYFNEVEQNVNYINENNNQLINENNKIEEIEEE